MRNSHFFDTGISDALQRRDLSTGGRKAGAALEGLVAQHLRAWIDYPSSGEQAVLLADPLAGSEVDFVVYGKIPFHAIEVKTQPLYIPRTECAQGVRAGDYPEAKRTILYRGKEKLLKDGIMIQPCADFLVNLG